MAAAAIALLLGQALEQVGRGAWGHRLCSTPTMWRGGSKAPRPLLPWGAAGRRWPNDSLIQSILQLIVGSWHGVFLLRLNDFVAGHWLEFCSG